MSYEEFHEQKLGELVGAEPGQFTQSEIDEKLRALITKLKLPNKEVIDGYIKAKYETYKLKPQEDGQISYTGLYFHSLGLDFADIAKANPEVANVLKTTADAVNAIFDLGYKVGKQAYKYSNWAGLTYYDDEITSELLNVMMHQSEANAKQIESLEQEVSSYIADKISDLTVEQLKSLEVFADSLSIVGAGAVIKKGLSHAMSKAASKVVKLNSKISAGHTGFTIEKFTSATEDVANNGVYYKKWFEGFDEVHINKDLNLPVDLNSPKLSRKYDAHAKDFGLEGVPRNKQSVLQFKEKIMNHINDPNTEVIVGTHRGKEPVIHYYNDITKRNVMKDLNGNFVSGWELIEDQWKSLKRNGNVQ